MLCFSLEVLISNYLYLFLTCLTGALHPSGKDSRLLVFRLSAVQKGIETKQMIRSKYDCRENKLERTKGNFIILCRKHALWYVACSCQRLISSLEAVVGVRLYFFLWTVNSNFVKLTCETKSGIVQHDILELCKNTMLLGNHC